MKEGEGGNMGKGVREEKRVGQCTLPVQCKEKEDRLWPEWAIEYD